VTYDPNTPLNLPFHFWSAVFFIFGTMVGSFANVCIYRMPRGLSVVSPPSHCPQCGYGIPWWLNIPLVTWLALRGKCANCKLGISPRYFLVELLTGLAFLSCWLTFGRLSVALAGVYCLVMAGFIVATFIDLEHFIIPDEITLGGVGAGFLCSLLVPALHGASGSAPSLERSFLGIAVGGGLVYGILRLGKLLFGRQNLKLEPGTRVVFAETALHLPDREIPYEELFYRKSDTIRFQAARIELVDRCFAAATVRLSPQRLLIDEITLNPEEISHLEADADELVLPREAMGLGDVKFMAGIGAFLGWQGVVFSLMGSAILGSIVGVGLIALGKREWSSRIPYGPYIAVAATIWIFGRQRLLEMLLVGR
jgi:leader peptidase (prepilin peptidase)/N-methyltransferase